MSFFWIASIWNWPIPRQLKTISSIADPAMSVPKLYAKNVDIGMSARRTP
jgi:poly(A) polymerase Pap1